MKKLFFLLTIVLLITIAACNRGGSASGGGSGPTVAGISGVNLNRPTPASDFAYELTADGKGVKITRYTGNNTNIIVPDKIEGYPVVEIGNYVFQGEVNKEVRPAYTAEYIYLPDSVTKIGDGIFDTTPNLREVRLSDNITVIPFVAFRFVSRESTSQSPKLVKVNLPKALQEIRSSAFYGQVELSELIIPDSIQSVRFIENVYGNEQPNNNAFIGCGKLPLATRAKIEGWGYTGSSLGSSSPF